MTNKMPLIGRKYRLIENHAWIVEVTDLITVESNIWGDEVLGVKSERGGIPQHYDVITNDQLKEIAGGTNLTTIFSSIQSSIASYKLSYKNNFVNPRIENLTKASTFSDELKNKIDVATHPLFVKLDIRAPDVDWTGEFLDPAKPYSNKFFFDGVYMMLFIKTTFSAGKFSHSMTLIPYDIDGSYSSSRDSSSTNR